MENIPLSHLPIPQLLSTQLIVHRLFHEPKHGHYIIHHRHVSVFPFNSDILNIILRLQKIATS